MAVRTATAARATVAMLTAAAFSRMTRVIPARGIIVVGPWIIGIRIVIVGVAIAGGTIIPIIAPIVAFIIALIRHAGGQGGHET